MKLILLLILTLASTFGQSTTTPTFEVASVRPHTFPKGTFGWTTNDVAATVKISGTRVSAIQTTDQRLLMYAYGVKDDQIIGETSRDFYDMAATTPGENAPADDQVRQMMQTLLADRFHLKLHRETRDLPVYNLIVGKNGSKLKESAPDAKSGATSAITEFPAIPTTYSNATISDLIRILSQSADRPVLDRTGLKGGYDFSVEFSRAQPGSKEADAGDPAATSVFTAVQEQLGLKLDPAKEPMEVLVIDHVEGPSAN